MAVPLQRNYTAASDPERWKTPLAGLRRTTLRTGYVSVQIGRGDWEAEHRMVMAQMLGRPLRRGESPHHRNGDRADNRPENLELWVGGHRAGRRASETVKCPHCGAALVLSAE